MKMLEILTRLPEWDIETQIENMMSEKWYWQTFSIQGATNLSFVKKMQYL
jgi:hypothetical protein